MKRLGIGLLAWFFVGCNSGSPVTSCTLASYTQTPDSGMGVPIRKAPVYPGASAAQSFRVVQSGGGSASPSPNASPRTTALSSTPTNAQVQLAMAGTFAAGQQSLVATIEGDVSGEPDSSPIFTSTAVDASTLSATPSNVSFTFQGTGGLDPTLTYWLRITGSFPASTQSYVTWSAADGLSKAYQVGSSIFGSVYETGTINNFSHANIGSYRFLYFILGC